MRLTLGALLVVTVPVFVDASNGTCNGYSSLCSKLYSNVTFLGAHNSASVGTSISDNQHSDVSTQLADGIRLLQGQGHNSSSNSASGINLCHSSCSLQNGGTLEKYLAKVKTWVVANPTEVVTILWVNSDGNPVSNWAMAYESSGLASHSYSPAADKVAAWPTLETLIDAGTTVVNFITSGANHATVPYILGEWTNIWETPYENTDYKNFTCGLDRGTRPNLLYLANHFAYSEMTFLGATIDSPDTDDIGKTNSLANVQAHASLCASSNSRYPNFFLVDFYEKASGGALQAVAAMNNVQYVSKKLGSGAANAFTTFFGGQNEIRNIAIVVAAGVVALILLWIAICCCCRRKTRKRRDSIEEELIKPVQMNTLGEPAIPRSFANRLSQQPRYAPVYGDNEMLGLPRPGVSDHRSRADSQSSLASSNTAFSEIRGSTRPLPTPKSNVLTGYAPYSEVRNYHQGSHHGPGSGSVWNTRS